MVRQVTRTRFSVKGVVLGTYASLRIGSGIHGYPSDFSIFFRSFCANAFFFGLCVTGGQVTGAGRVTFHLSTV